MASSHRQRRNPLKWDIALAAASIAIMCILCTCTGLANAAKQSNPHMQRDAAAAKASSVILVTGAAGFVGMHAAIALSRDLRVRLIGIDNFSGGSDVDGILKQERAMQLKAHNVTIFNSDVCDMVLMEMLFRRFQFTHVVHLAALAGVRSSLLNPVAFVHANVRCFARLLDMARKAPEMYGGQIPKVVFASSSSVYGMSSKSTNSVKDRTDGQTSVYGASKKADELLAHAYHVRFGMTLVGLRFFTVYGPWNRHDMAMYLFSDAIWKGDEIDVFDRGNLKRDFTYVTDIVRGVIAAVHKKIAGGFRIFNLGNTNPHTVSYLIGEIERELGQKARRRFMPFQKGDVVQTSADVTETTEALGYEPLTPLTEGVRRFADWYREFADLLARDNGTSSGRRGPAFIKALLKQRRAMHSAGIEMVTSLSNNATTVRTRADYDRWKAEVADPHKIALPDRSPRTFTFYKGRDSSGGDVIQSIRHARNPVEMQRMCDAIPMCVAFNTDGLLKINVQSQAKWRSYNSSGMGGLYVADINPCERDIHACHERSQCMHVGPAKFRCVCKDGYVGNGISCTPLFDTDGLPTDPTVLERVRPFLKTPLPPRNYTFIPFLDSPGYDLKHADGLERNIPQLKALCDSTPDCGAFNTNGRLKTVVGTPRSEWKQWTGNVTEGFYIAHVDHCAAGSHDCHHRARCMYVPEGLFECQCLPGFTGDGRHCRSVLEAIESDSFTTDDPEPPAVLNYVARIDEKPAEADYDMNASKMRPPWLVNVQVAMDRRPKLIDDHMYQQQLTRISREHRIVDAQKRDKHADSNGESGVGGDAAAAVDAIAAAPPEAAADGTGGRLPLGSRGKGGKWKKGQVVDILLAGDPEHYKGLLAVIESVRRNTPDPSRVRFHIALANDGLKNTIPFERMLECYGIAKYDEEGKDIIELRHFNARVHAKHALTVHGAKSVFGNLASDANLARFYFARMFPFVTKAIYLDADVVVRGDIVGLWQVVQSMPTLFAAVKRESPTYGTLFGQKSDLVRTKLEKRFNRTYRDDDATFNAGVYAVDLGRWQALNVTAEAEYWIDSNARERLWSFGSQPVLLLSMAGRWTELPREWNFDGLGWRRSDDVNKDLMTKAKLLHFSGRQKPWTAQANDFSTLWREIAGLRECSSHGRCHSVLGCICEEGYEGISCDMKVQEGAIAGGANSGRIRGRV